MNDRRDFFGRIASVGAGLWAGRKATAQQPQSMPGMPGMPGHTMPATTVSKDRGTTHGGEGRMAVDLPDLPNLPYKMIDGVKEFKLTAEVVRTEFVPGRVVDAWGYNGSVPGPTIEVNQGDRVRVIFDNHLPEMTAIHWHGFEVPMEMDGSVGLGQDPVPPGGRYVYEFELHQAGTFFYHSHFAMQEMMGMLGMFIMHPKTPLAPRVDRDFGIVIQEWALLPNNTVPNALSMEFNWLTFNGKAGPACTPMLVKQGERVRIRMINLGMDHHPIHLHGNQFSVTGTEAGRIPQHLWYDQNTVLVGVAQARDIEFEAKYVGEWMLHCHLPHHMMNQMMSMVGPVMHGGIGIHTGGSMVAGMGIVRQSNALSEELGPALGRGIGLAADSERLISNIAGQDASKMMAAAQSPPMAMQGHNMAGMTNQANGAATDYYPKDDPEKKKVAGYPQDMWMPMDEMFKKPENYGLRPGWSGAMGGMMTLVRVLPEEVYDKIMDLKQEQRDNSKEKPDENKGMQHKHEE